MFHEEDHLQKYCSLYFTKIHYSIKFHDHNSHGRHDNIIDGGEVKIMKLRLFLLELYSYQVASVSVCLFRYWRQTWIP
jgi:hypothetical protein